jgi:tRNA pseudouridine38-40 synthase
MHRYFVKCAYDGTDFSGWQIQNNAPSIQDSLQDAFSKVLRQSIEIVGCGRTDAGVHASEYYFHFDTEEPLNDKSFISINRVLPIDIQLIDFQLVEKDAHARFHAKARQYRYQICLTEDPFRRRYHHQLKNPNLYDLKCLIEHSKVFLGVHDFEYFSKTGSDVNHYSCEIFKSEWIQIGDSWTYTVQANRFMRGMVRLLVGAQLQLASGKISIDDIENALNKKSRLKYNLSAPGKALFLEKIDYDFIIG